MSDVLTICATLGCGVCSAFDCNRHSCAVNMQAIVLHRQQVHSKLVYIMRERLSKALKTFHSVSAAWDACEAPDNMEHNLPTSLSGNAAGVAADAQTLQRKAVSTLLEQLMKQVATLAAVLKPIMSQAQLADIFLRIRRMYGDSLARCVLQCRCCSCTAHGHSMCGFVASQALATGVLYSRCDWWAGVQGFAQLATGRSTLVTCCVQRRGASACCAGSPAG